VKGAAETAGVAKTKLFCHLANRQTRGFELPQCHITPRMLDEGRMGHASLTQAPLQRTHTAPDVLGHPFDRRITIGHQNLDYRLIFAFD
jgi:hypothetical protein